MGSTGEEGSAGSLHYPGPLLHRRHRLSRYGHIDSQGHFTEWLELMSSMVKLYSRFNINY